MDMAELIVALDHTEAAAAVACLDALPDGAAVKVGSVLMTAAGPGFVRGLTAAGHPVFLDLKWHDIPNTVAGAIRSAAELGLDMVTVHALGGRAMLEAAVEAAGDAVRVVAVTVLTSHDLASFEAVLGRPVDDLRLEVSRLAGMAVGAGVHGLVCSAAELPVVAPIAAGRRVVVPGIRRSGDAPGDQQRTATPAEAVRGGATHLVVGRPITAAADPGAAWQAFRDLLEG
ncbi:MAG: orotidine-5'-phosphate decarboxylase [Gemmatimonadetes bacterium]|nr:orotidine-5'-phosphate decarboxylase [Gemmatimonadota bacterium]MCA9767526.1 orotidine-5'-phosphate decarboxylase [Gemmatimonadota bacterium]